MHSLQTMQPIIPGVSEPPITARRAISERRLAANRRNALHSTGPRTEEGKAVSSLNACRHGLTGQINVLTDEDRAAKDKFCQALIDDLKPEGALEDQLALSIAEDHWRLNRARGLEDNIFALGHYTPAGDIEVENPELHAALTAARVFLESARQFQLLTLYEQRIHRALQKNTAQLEAIQAKRQAARANSLEEAAQRTQVAEIHEEEPETAIDGFVFSTGEISAHIHRKDRLREAAWHERTHWTGEEYPFARHAA